MFRGKTITDPALITELSEHIGKAEDESDVWLPARMAPFIRDALEGYEQGRHGVRVHRPGWRGRHLMTAEGEAAGGKSG